jgi:hypothetical protein
MLAVVRLVGFFVLWFVAWILARCLRAILDRRRARTGRPPGRLYEFLFKRR